MADFLLIFQKFGKNRRNMIFPFRKLILIQKYLIFLEKNNGQKPRWRQVGYFFNKNSTETSFSGFVRNIFLTQIC
jgi:hypothetical protein